MNEELSYAINDVLSCETLTEALWTYEHYNVLLEDCSFLFFNDEHGTEIPSYLKCNYIDKFMVHNLTLKDKIFVLDKTTCKEMRNNNTSYFTIDTCVVLDTQAVSYIEKALGNNCRVVSDKYKALFDFLLINDLDYDFSLYMMENAIKLTSQEMKIETYKNIIACEKFKSIDRNEYCKSGKIEYTKEESEIYMRSDDVFRLMNNDSQSDRVSAFWDRYYLIYALLLKACYIELSVKKSIKYKMELLFEFVNNELGVISEREMAVCYLFFIHDKSMNRFFKKIKLNSKQLLKNIAGMAWDLHHIRAMEFNMGNYRPFNVRYSLYSLITFDNGLKDVLNACPVDRYAIINGIIIPKLKTPLYKLIKEIDAFNLIYNNKDKRCMVSSEVNYKNLMLQLERDIFQLSGK